MSYLEEEAQVLYRSKDGKEEKIFDALEWLAAMCSHVPGKGEQMVRYYGYYSNVSRGRRKKQNEDNLIPCILETDELSQGSRKNWARMIRKIYQVDPLVCPKCQGRMRIVSFHRRSANYQEDSHPPWALVGAIKTSTAGPTRNSEEFRKAGLVE